jgi:hypothetical protein
MALYVDDPFLSHPQKEPTAVEIICGDCSGEGVWPAVRKMTEDGRCEVCKGRSFVNAEILGSRLMEIVQSSLFWGPIQRLWTMNVPISTSYGYDSVLRRDESVARERGR